MTNRQPTLRDYSRSRAVLIGTWKYFAMPELAAAHNSYRRMSELLTDELCGWPRNRLVHLENVANAGDVHDRLITAFDDVTDVALFYYVGHGQNGHNEELCLALPHTRTEFNRRNATSLQFSAVRQALLSSQATTKIVILDCCFAGQATQVSNSLSVLTEASGKALAATVVEKTFGTRAYTMAAAGAYTPAEYETGGRSPQTYFTKYLVDLVRRGMPGQPAVLMLEPLFQELRDQLAGDGLPLPERRNVDVGGDFAFAYNAAPPEAPRNPEAELARLWATVGGSAITAAGGARPSVAQAPIPIPRPGRRFSRAPAPSPHPIPRLQADQPGATRRSRRGLTVLLATLSLATVLGAMGSWLLTRNSPAAAASASYAFSPIRYADGLVITRGWTVTGHDGSMFTETITAASTTGSALNVSLVEPVLPAARPYLASAHFRPAQPKILAGRELEWQLRVPASGSITVSYLTAVPAGQVSESRLHDWAGPFVKLAAALPGPSGALRLRSLAIHPTRVHLSVGRQAQLTVSGVLANGRKASAGALSGVLWHSGKPSAVTVSSSGKITAVAAGTAQITASAGGISMRITVVVGPARTHPGGDGSSSQPTPSPTSPQPVPGPTHTPEPTSSSRPSTTPTITPPPI